MFYLNSTSFLSSGDGKTRQAFLVIRDIKKIEQYKNVTRLRSSHGLICNTRASDHSKEHPPDVTSWSIPSTEMVALAIGLP